MFCGKCVTTGFLAKEGLTVGIARLTASKSRTPPPDCGGAKYPNSKRFASVHLDRKGKISLRNMVFLKFLSEISY